MKEVRVFGVSLAEDVQVALLELISVYQAKCQITSEAYSSCFKLGKFSLMIEKF